MPAWLHASRTRSWEGHRSPELRRTGVHADDEAWGCGGSCLAIVKALGSSKQAQLAPGFGWGRPHPEELLERLVDITELNHSSSTWRGFQTGAGSGSLDQEHFNDLGHQLSLGKGLVGGSWAGAGSQGNALVLDCSCPVVVQTVPWVVKALNEASSEVDWLPERARLCEVASDSSDSSSRLSIEADV